MYIILTLLLAIVNLPSNDSSLDDLLRAIENEDTVSIKKHLISNPELLNYTDTVDVYKTPLIRAVAYRKKASVMVLLDLGANPNVISVKNWTPLLAAINYGIYDNYEFNQDSSYVELLLKYGANPNYEYIQPPAFTGEHNVDEKSMLMSAISPINSGIEKVKLLLEYGADVNYKNSLGQTAAIYALKDADVEVAYELIVKRNANIGEAYFEKDFDGTVIILPDFQTDTIMAV